MNLRDYLQRAEAEPSLPRPVLEVFEGENPADLTEPLSQFRPALRLCTSEYLVDLVLARYRWLEWRKRATEALLDGISTELLHQTLLPDEVSAILRADKTASAGEGDEAARAAVRDALYGVWNKCMATAMDHSQLEVVLANATHPRAGMVGHLVGSQGALALLAPERWLEIKRGIRNSVLSLAWTHPTDAMVEAVAEYLPALTGLLGDKDASALIEEHVLPHLSTELEGRFGRKIEEDIGRTTGDQYRVLLSAEGHRALPMGAVFVGSDRQRLGMAILDKRGAVSATAPIRPSGQWCDRVARWMSDQKARVIVLPDKALAPKWLEQLKESLEEGRTGLYEVSVAGLIVARGIDDPTLKRVSPEEASAIVIARRAHRPLDEWTRIEPLKLGLAPFQSELDPNRLREVMQVVRERCVALGQPMSTAPITTGGIRGRSSAPLNPEITSIRDLRPGLSLNGTVTNVTKFGAFVNLGLRQEGLIHISELSDEFVNDPSEVVQTGQRVTCRVISVDLDRGRIALSMRTEGAAAMRRPGGTGPNAGRGPRSTAGQASHNPAERSRALADLESFFKN